MKRGTFYRYGRTRVYENKHNPRQITSGHDSPLATAQYHPNVLVLDHIREKIWYDQDEKRKPSDEIPCASSTFKNKKFELKK